MFSKKATKVVTIFTVNLTVCSNHQLDGEDFVNFCGLLKKRELYLSGYLVSKVEHNLVSNDAHRKKPHNHDQIALTIYCIVQFPK